MSKLGAHLKSLGITFAEFGERIGKDKSTVSRICAGKVNVDRETAAAIFRETGGAITPNDLFNIPATEEAA
ncbi:helix-turn-helix transcriptional regulator [Shumkonia mesophila]|uniref:helix-turn-helix transcriptional regulator n=1 Tax=Shumkonia mesophila TaxID=2838854 RepID=UPI0029350A1D|nr:helix-turn-helix transcriptional regulator [Shumkonia mesophila]